MEIFSVISFCVIILNLHESYIELMPTLWPHGSQMIKLILSLGSNRNDLFWQQSNICTQMQLSIFELFRKNRWDSIKKNNHISGANGHI